MGGCAPSPVRDSSCAWAERYGFIASPSCLGGGGFVLLVLDLAVILYGFYRGVTI
jgi:hypothetical protein